MEVAAEKATVERSEGRARQKESVAASQMVRMGDLNRASTLTKKGGRPRVLFTDWSQNKGAYLGYD